MKQIGLTATPHQKSLRKQDLLALGQQHMQIASELKHVLILVAEIKLTHHHLPVPFPSRIPRVNLKKATQIFIVLHSVFQISKTISLFQNC